jgi:hypothetical protein
VWVGKHAGMDHALPDFIDEKEVLARLSLEVLSNMQVRILLCSSMWVSLM